MRNRGLYFLRTRHMQYVARRATATCGGVAPPSTHVQQVHGVPSVRKSWVGAKSEFRIEPIHLDTRRLSEGWPKWSPASACQAGGQVVDMPHENPKSPRAQWARFWPSRAGFGRSFQARPGIQHPECIRIANDEPCTTCEPREAGHFKRVGKSPRRRWDRAMRAGRQEDGRWRAGHGERQGNACTCASVCALAC